MIRELSLTEIWIYPIKSLGGIRLSTAKVLPKGLAYDRRWMLVDKNGSFMTQRVYPKMALFKLSIDENQLTIRHHEEEINLPLRHSTNNSKEVKIWDDTVTAFEVGEAYSRWFSNLLQMECELVYFPEENLRPVDPVYNINDDHVSLADAYPFLIIGQSSLDDLNTKLSLQVPMNRFRPNFVFSGGSPYEEDVWKDFTIGNNRFVGVKPCARCVLTTVNQDTAEKTSEPLRTLATYRARNNKIYFGQNLLALDYSTVSVGDKIVLN